MAELLDTYIQNNFGLFDQNRNSSNAIIDTYGAYVLMFLDSWAPSKSKRIVIGSNTIQWYQDTIVSGANRDFNITGIETSGPMMNLFNLPKKTELQEYIALVPSDSAIFNNAYIIEGIKEGEFITWTDNDKVLFSVNELMNWSYSACACNSHIVAYGVNQSTQDLMASVYDYIYVAPYDVITEDSKYYYPISSCYVDDDGYGGVVSAVGTPDPVDATYVPFSWVDNSFGTPTDLSLAPGVVDGSVIETAIAYDRINGNIIILTTFFDADDDPNFDIVFELHVSTDGGSTFSKINLDTTGLLGGADNFQDVCNYYRGTPDLLAGATGGFLMGYTRINEAGVARPYVHECTFVGSGEGDIGGYSIGAAKECGMAAGPFDETVNMIGPIFFKPPADMLATIDPVQNVYIGYQAGEGNQIYTNFAQASAKSVGLILEKLDEQAYPVTIDYTYEEESSAPSGELVVGAPVLDTPKDHVDYYAQGYTGGYTTLAVDAFTKVGTTVEIEQYEPISDIWVGGRTAYDQPIIHVVKCFLDSASWNSPNQALNQADYDEFIDRDLRKIYLPPGFFMEYTGVLSNSNEYFQTVYLVKFDGFTYEIRQVVPKFIDNQIIYWEGNCYNVGNFDVWSRGGGQA